MSELQLKPEEALFIDDSIVNVTSARKMGMNSILMARGEKCDVDSEPMKIGQLDHLFFVLE